MWRRPVPAETGSGRSCSSAAIGAVPVDHDRDLRGSVDDAPVNAGRSRGTEAPERSEAAGSELESLGPSGMVQESSVGPRRAPSRRRRINERRLRLSRAGHRGCQRRSVRQVISGRGPTVPEPRSGQPCAVTGGPARTSQPYEDTEQLHRPLVGHDRSWSDHGHSNIC